MEPVSSRHLPSIVALSSWLLAMLLSIYGGSLIAPLIIASIALLGIPHGALDLHIIGATSSSIREVVLYLTGIALVVLAWYFAPALMLVVFLVNSAWHFGDCDLQHMHRWRAISSLIYGCAILVVLINPSDPTISDILQQLVPTTSLALDGSLYLNIRIVAASVVLILPLSQDADHRVASVVRSVLVVAAAFLLPSLVAFAWYFAAIHSWSSLRALRLHLNQHESWSWSRLILASVPLTLVTFIGIGIAYLVLPHAAILPLLFISLSALTVPHSRLFHRVYV
jgi:Brp/Blh family beta-carotene 15,15'-monooxygenase